MENVNEEVDGSGGRFGLDWFFEVVDGDIRAVLFAKKRFVKP